MKIAMTALRVSSYLQFSQTALSYDVVAATVFTCAVVLSCVYVVGEVLKINQVVLHRFHYSRLLCAYAPPCSLFSQHSQVRL